MDQAHLKRSSIREVCILYHIIEKKKPPGVQVVSLTGFHCPDRNAIRKFKLS